MSDFNVNVSIDLPESVDNAIKNLTDQPTKNIGQTLADCWYIAFGGISQAAEKRRIKYIMELENFKKELESSTSEVPENLRREPSTQIILSALENAKVCVEEKELRDMFTALITASIDSTQTVHPSFAHIISQMSPNDAKMMKFLLRQRHFPICDIVCQTRNGEHIRILRQNVFIDGPESMSETEKSLSISSLLALGLVEIPSDLYLSEQGSKIFYESEQYTELLSSHNPNELSVEAKIVRLSNLGQLFASCCVRKRAYGTLE